MSKKLTHEQFLDKIKGRLDEFEILSKYETAIVKIKARCKRCGYEFSAKPHHFIDGGGCRKCQYRKISALKQKGFDCFLSNLPDKYKGYKFTNFTTCTGPITAECQKCGRVHNYYSAKSFTQGTAGCRSCNSNFRRSDGSLRKLCDDNGFILLSRLSPRQSGKYMVSQAKVQCKECGRISRKNISNISKSGCKYCHKNWSKYEQEIFDWVKSMCPDAEQSVRGIISNELDIYVPSCNVAIEYNGTYWHSDKYKDKHYHSNKSMECRDKGIRLIHIWEYEWKDARKREVLKNIILGALHKLPERYYARQCKVEVYRKGEYRWKEINKFFADNNIQGNRNGSIVFTLEIKGRILMAYKFGRPSGGKTKSKYEYEMVRGATALGVQVVGGATRLWSHFIKTIKPKNVVYYVDFNYFDGCSVEKLGGEYVGHTDSYKNWWVKDNVVKNRDPKHHKEIAELEKNGVVRRVWNAGVLAYKFEY